VVARALSAEDGFKLNCTARHIRECAGVIYVFTEVMTARPNARAAFQRG
jgi:hypothetical protein